MNAMLLLWLIAADGPFAFEERAGGQLALTENGKLVWVYNYGPQLRPGAPEDRRRSSYLHPVCTPAGVVVTDDFPRDHYHHRGIFWAWPVVRVAGSQYDVWTLKGAGQQFVRWGGRSVSANAARLEVENGWFVGGRKVVREIVEIETARAAGPAREFSITLQVEALEEPVDIAGSPDQGKGYGGLSARFAPRTQTAIRTDNAAVPGDEDHGPHAWAELEGRFGDSRAGLRITADPRNPGFPHEWCLRQYGFTGASFPGVKGFRLESGRPVRLRYRVRVFDLPAVP